MSELPRPGPRYYLGADSGEKGGLAIIDAKGNLISVDPVPSTAKKLLDLLKLLKYVVPITHCAIERIDPRPTGFKDKSGRWVQSILRSTCIIYGDYLQLHMALLAIDLDPEIVGPKDWQRSFGLKREVGETKAKYKGRIKELAQDLFPGAHVTLKVADALMLAEYCRKRNEDAQG